MDKGMAVTGEIDKRELHGILPIPTSSGQWTDIPTMHLHTQRQTKAVMILRCHSFIEKMVVGCSLYHGFHNLPSCHIYDTDGSDEMRLSRDILSRLSMRSNILLSSVSLSCLRKKKPCVFIYSTTVFETIFLKCFNQMKMQVNLSETSWKTKKSSFFALGSYKNHR